MTNHDERIDRVQEFEIFPPKFRFKDLLDP